MPSRAHRRPGGSSYCHDWQYTICSDSTADSTSPRAEASCAAARHVSSHIASGSGAGPSAGRATICATPMMHGLRGSTTVLICTATSPCASRQTPRFVGAAPPDPIAVRLAGARPPGRHSPRSFVLPLRLALLGKRLRTLFRVLGGEHHLRQRRFDLVGLFHRDLHP